MTRSREVPELVWCQIEELVLRRGIRRSPEWKTQFRRTFAAAVRAAHAPVTTRLMQPARVKKRLQTLRNNLAEFQIGRSGETVGLVLAHTDFPRLEDLILELDVAIEKAPHVLPGQNRKRGTSVHPRFDSFIGEVLRIARVCGFEWTAYRDRDHGDCPARGNLIEALAILKDYLPPGFCPASDATLIHAIDRCRKPLRG